MMYLVTFENALGTRTAFAVTAETVNMARPVARTAYISAYRRLPEDDGYRIVTVEPRRESHGQVTGGVSQRS